MKVQKLQINSIKVSNRVREDMGDMDTLRRSIEKYGLINPIMVDKNNRLIAGERRLKIMRDMGYIEIDAHVIDEGSDIVKLDLEMQENLVRKDFTESEIIKSIELKKKLLRKPWYTRFLIFLKNAFTNIISLFRKK
ncbi:MAG: ParB N-terminal domain-containing protein [Spirochaetes bacterium]|nr:ParB N-terminal domain-containing protein [Spirochaetota bacterium]